MLSEEKLSGIEKVLRDEDVPVAYLFGSYAEGNELEESDVDVGILVQDPESYSFKRLMEIQLRLSDKVGEKVDLRLLNGKDNRFVYNVLRTGELIFSDDENLRSDFEYRHMKKYFDLKNFYRERDRFVEQRVTA